MLSLSRCPSKKRKKKSSSSSSSSSLTVVPKSSIASMDLYKTKEEEEEEDDDISFSPPQSSSNSKTVNGEPLKENQEQQVQKLKRHRERKRRRQMRMESALESILKPCVQLSDSTELKRMETRFWNDSDSDDEYDEIEEQTPGPPFAEPFCHISTKSQNTTTDRTKETAVTGSKPPILNLSLGGNVNGSKSDNDPETPITTKKRISKLGQQARPSSPKTKDKEVTSSGLINTYDIQILSADELDSGDVEFDEDDDNRFPCLRANGKSMTGVQSGHNSTVPKSDKDKGPIIPHSRDCGLELNGNEALKGKTKESNQSSHEVTNQAAGLIAPSTTDAPEKAMTSISQSDSNVQPKVPPSSLCENVNIRSPAKLQTEHDLFRPHQLRSKNRPSQLKSTDQLELESKVTEATASDTEPAISSATFPDEQTELILVENHAAKSGSNILQKPKSKASKSSVSPTPSSFKSAKTIPKHEKVASDDTEGTSPNKKRRKRVAKKSEVPATECVEMDSDCDHVASKKTSQRGKKRDRKRSCALCTTCPCRKARSDETFGELGLQSFAQSDSAMEKALIRRLKKIEKSCENLQDQQETIKRKLKKHRRDILRKKTKVPSEDEGISYFLPDADELDTSECQPTRVADDWVTYAQKRMFPSTLDDNQPSLTQLGFWSSKSKKPIDESEEPPDTHIETQGASTEDSHHEPVESVVDEFEIGKSQNCTNEYDKREDEEDSKASFLESTTEEDIETGDTRSGCEKAYRITWRNGSKRTNDLVATSALEGLVVHPEEAQQVDDANSVLSLTQEERPMGRIEPCPWDSLFSDCAMGNEIDHFVKLTGFKSLCGTQESSARSVCGVGNSVASCFDDSTQGGARIFITKISSDVTNVDALKKVCPNWKENVSFAFGQSKEDIQNALENLQESRTRLYRTKQMILDAWDRNRTTMDIFKDALEKSLNRFKS
ncbi:unnamed protein product [Cylindrotheca closterium]|uniref:Uncharacterized protein n=1 Tax=Cylindrotheca closterium TaxID=2856 RepID=A0AAD2G8H1_9STRA|nr:unnamed protein product [Cylindrotheca closterium]